MRFLIVIVIIIGLSAVIGAIVVGKLVFDGKVTEKPYETGLMWDKIQKEALALGWDVTIKNERLLKGNNKMILSVHTKEGLPLINSAISITVSRPATVAYNKKYNAVEIGNGLYSAQVDFPLYGYWDIKINISKDAKGVIIEKKIFIEHNCILPYSQARIQ